MFLNVVYLACYIGRKSSTIYDLSFNGGDGWDTLKTYNMYVRIP